MGVLGAPFFLPMPQSSLIVLLSLLLYFALLLALARKVASRRSSQGNDAFFLAQRRAPWPLVAVGMVAGSMSGVSLVSVPGWVGTTAMTYLPMCMGFALGYAVVAFVLLPLYYRSRLTSIYSYLGSRFGPVSHRTGALIFLLSKLLGASVRLYLATMVLHTLIAAPLGLPYGLTATLTLLLIWLYTQRAGQASLLYTDVLQTLAMLLALLGMLWAASAALHLSPLEAWDFVVDSPMARVWEWEATSPQATWRQVLSGVAIVVVMTGLDQDMMQKNLTCPDLRSAQKEMLSYGMTFLPINALLLALGILLHAVYAQHALPLPAQGDALLPTLIGSGTLGLWVLLPFAIGMSAAAFSAADGALTALTTSICLDLYGCPDSLRLRRRVHLFVALLTLLCVLAFSLVGSGTVIHAIYVLASYTYGPLLGLFAYGLATSRPVADRFVPLVALAAPLLCLLLDHYLPLLTGYRLGYELLLLNGLLTALGLWLIRPRGQAAVAMGIKA